MTNAQTPIRRTLGDLSVAELLDRALSETLDLGNRFDRVAMSPDDRLLFNAYIGSIGASLSVAQDKIGR